jgi:hypothetical protein
LFLLCSIGKRLQSSVEAVGHEAGISSMLLRRSAFGILAAIFLLSGAEASAGDYTVSYAFDAGEELNDAGKQTCEYKSFCTIVSEKLKLSILLAFWDPNHRVVTISVSGEKGRWGCCYFSDGANSIERNVKDSLVRVYVYVGRRRIRNEFIVNEPLGTLYLQFLDMK